MYDKPWEYLHQAYNMLAPKGREQIVMATAINDMQKAGLSDKSITINIAGAILDGLDHGNWPR